MYFLTLSCEDSAAAKNALWECFQPTHGQLLPSAGSGIGMVSSEFRGFPGISRGAAEALRRQISAAINGTGGERTHGPVVNGEEI